MTRLISCFVAIFVLATHAYAERSIDPIMGLMRLDQQKFSALPHGDLGPVNAPATDAGIYSEAYLRGLPVAKGGKEWACLTEALYFEARGETVKGQFAVGEVILNRVSSPSFPDTICGVINQGTGRKFACQFTYTNIFAPLTPPLLTSAPIPTSLSFKLTAPMSPTTNSPTPTSHRFLFIITPPMETRLQVLSSSPCLSV